MNKIDEPKSFFDLPQPDQENIINKAADASNREQKRMVDEPKESWREEFLSLLEKYEDNDPMSWNGIDEDSLTDFVQSEIDRAYLQGKTETDKGHFQIYKWLLGYYDFPEVHKGRTYAWRTELRKKLPKEILELLSKEEEK